MGIWAGPGTWAFYGGALESGCLSALFWNRAGGGFIDVRWGHTFKVFVRVE